MPRTFEDFFIVENSDGFYSYSSDLYGNPWYLGIFEADNQIAPRDLFFTSNITEVTMLLVGGGGGGGLKGNPYTVQWGNGGGGGGHLLIKTPVGVGGALIPQNVYDIIVGKGGTSVSGSGSYPGGATMFGYREYGSMKCPEVSGGKSGSNQIHPGEAGNVVADGSSVGFSVINSGIGGAGGLRGDSGGQNGADASFITDPAYGDTSKPGNYYLGSYAGTMFGSISVGGGGGGGSGTLYIAGNGGQGASGGQGGLGGTFPATVPPGSAGTNGTFAANNPAPGHTLLVGGGGGGVGGYTSGSYNGGQGAGGVFIMWFQGPPINVDPTYSIDTDYYTINYSETALITNSYREISYPDSKKIGCYTSVVVGGKNANITFKNALASVTADVNVLLVGGGGGGGGGDDRFDDSAQTTYSGNGGGGGGHYYGTGTAGLSGTEFIVGTQYNIVLGNGGLGQFGPDAGLPGEDSTFGVGTWTTPMHVSGGGGGGARSNDSVTGVGGTVVTTGPLTQLYGGTGGDGGQGSTQTVPPPPPYTGQPGAPGSSGADAANGNNGPGSYAFDGFGVVTIGGGGGGGGGMRSKFQSYSSASGDGGYAGYGTGGPGGNGPSTYDFFRAQSAPMRVSGIQAEGGGGGGGGGIPLRNITSEFGTYGGNGGDGVFVVHLVRLISPGVPVLTPNTDLSPYITVASTGPTSGFSGYTVEETYGDGSKMNWYLGVFESNNSITPNPSLNGIQVRMLLIGGGGGGGGGTNVTQAISGGGGGGGGHMLIQATAGQPQFQTTGTSYTINVGAAGIGGSGLAAGTDGGHTTFGSNIGAWVGQYPDVSGGGGGGNIGRGDFGAIVRTGASLGFNVLNADNNGGGGQGGSGSSGSSSSYAGGAGGDAAAVDGQYGNPSYPGWYYVGPNYGGLFGAMKASGSGGGGGGEYNISGTEPGKYGQGGFAGNQGFGGYGGTYTNTPQPVSYSNGQTATYSVAIGSGATSYVGAGGGGSGQPGVGLNTTGGSGVNGTFMIWFAVPDPVIYATPYYSIASVNGTVVNVSNEQTLYDGSKKTYYTGVVNGGLYNSIKFLSAANGMDADVLLAGGGGGGGGGMNQNYTYTGQGGGGAGHVLARGTVGSQFTVDTSYNITLGTGGKNGGGANPGYNGTDSYFGQNVWSPLYVHVTAGGGGAARNGGGPAFQGGVASSAPLTQLFGGTGGAGGSGGYTSSPTVMDGIKGGDAAVGNTAVSGLYVFPGYGAIGVCGGGGGGGGLQEAYAKYGDISGQGGFAGFGLGGLGGVSPYTGTDYDGVNAMSVVTSGYAIGGGGGGGGGIPYTPNGESIQSQGGSGGGGLFAVHMVIDTPAPPPPTPEPEYANPYFAFDNSNADLFVEWLDEGAVCQCGGIPSLQYIAITSADNVLRFFPDASGMPVDFILVGAGGQGGGSINSVVKHPGQGGGGGGIVYGTGVVGGNVAYDVSYNIEIGYNTQLGGYAVYGGTDGSGSRFGQNVWSPWVEATGGKGGGVFSVAGAGGTVASYGPLTPVPAYSGTGGDGGLQDSTGHGLTGGSAVTGSSGQSGVFTIQGFGDITCAGGGGGGAGISGEDTHGSGGRAGRGEGGQGGTITGHPPEGADGESVVEAGNARGGGGGGGAGIPQPAELESISYGGEGAKGLFIMFLHRPSNCNPVDPVCGCEINDPICGCGVVSKCPNPVDYVKLNTGGNDPKFNPAIAYALYVRGSLGRPGYQQLRTGNQPLNPFGSYAGAPGGSRAPPRNKFG